MSLKLHLSKIAVVIAFFPKVCNFEQGSFATDLLSLVLESFITCYLETLHSICQFSHDASWFTKLLEIAWMSEPWLMPVMRWLQAVAALIYRCVSSGWWASHILSYWTVKLQSMFTISKMQLPWVNSLTVLRAVRSAELVYFSWHSLYPQLINCNNQNVTHLWAAHPNKQ